MQRLLTAGVAGLAAWLSMIGTVAAGEPARTHDIEAEDYFTIAGIYGCATSPDGEYVAYYEARWEPPAEKRNIDLWVVDTRSKRIRRLTFDRAADASPQWSPDGKYIYFTSARKRGGEEDPPYSGKKQVWRISPRGGEPQAVTRVKEGIGTYQLAHDGAAVYYTVAEEEVADEWKDLRSKYKDLEYGHGVTEFSQVWKLDLESWRVEKIIDEKRVIVSLAVSPDQGRIAMITKPDETMLSNEGWSRVDVYDAATKDVRAVTPDGWRADHPTPFGWVDAVSWSRDGAALAFPVSFDGYPTRVYVAEWPGGPPRLHLLRAPDQVTISGGPAKWRGESRDLCFTGEERARVRVYCLTDVQDGRQGPTRVMSPGDVAVRAFSFSRGGGRLAAVLGTVEHPPDVFFVSKSGTYDRLTRVNPQVDTWKLPQISIVSWQGAHGNPVEGILELPPGYEPGEPLPTVIELHGGPTSATQYRLRLWIYGRTLLAAKGYALLSPNYRGSTGYGDKFLTDLIGHENDVEVEDILKGVDAMIERGIADPDRLGVIGWSNGGFLVNCLIAKTDRFKAASSGAGVLHQVMQWGLEDTPGHVINYMRDYPWSNPEAYGKGSPLYDLDKVKTPTLIHVGGSDDRVPPAHSRALYRALQHYLHVPVELVVYPGEGHSLWKYENRKSKMEWDLAWFERYLLGKTGEDSKKD